MNEELPSGWAGARVGDLARSNEQPVLTGPFGTSMGRGDFVSEGCPVLTIGCLTDSGIRVEKAMFVRAEKATELERYQLRTGDLLFSRMASVGRAGMVPETLDGALFNYHIMRLRLAESMMLPELFLAYVRGAAAVPKYLEDVNHGATRDGINTTQLVEMPVLVPPLNEQRRIVAKLEALQSRSRAAREALDAVPPLLEKLRQSILAAAFRGDLTKDWREKHPDVEPASELLKRIRVKRRKKWEEAELAKMKAKGKVPKDDKWKAKYKEPAPVDTTGLPELPKGWCWAAWTDVGFCQNGRAFPSAQYAKTGVKLLRPGNLHLSGELRWNQQNTRRMPSKWAEEFPEFLVGPDELLMNLTAQSLKDEFLGRVCLSGRGEKCLLNQRLARLTALALPARYWLYFFKSPGFRRYVDTLNTGSLIQHMFTSQVEACAVPLMPRDEAQFLVDAIDSKLATVGAMRTIVDEEPERLAGLDRSILAKAFRGELVPQDPNDEPAAVMLERIKAQQASGDNGAPIKKGKRRGPAERATSRRNR